MEINKKLKGIYFCWAKSYDADPRQRLDDTFQEYLEIIRYDFFDEKWLEKILTECNLPNKKEFDEQVVLIEAEYQKYSERQCKNFEKIKKKKANIYYDKCRKEGILPF